MEIQNIENWLQRLETRYIKEKAEQDKKIYDLEQQTKLFLQLANEVKELKDARLRQIELNGKILKSLNTVATNSEPKPTEPTKISFFSKLFK